MNDSELAAIEARFKVIGSGPAKARAWSGVSYEEVAALCRELRATREALEVAWGVIANAGGGDWTKESKDWQEAAARWRDEHWHPSLDRERAALSPSKEKP
jgi:hypothetical protein